MSVAVLVAGALEGEGGALSRELGLWSVEADVGVVRSGGGVVLLIHIK